MIAWNPHQTIESQLKPTDEVVVVTRDYIDGYVPARPLTARQVIEDLAVRADLVVVAKIDDVTTVFASEDSWIDTRLVGSIGAIWRQSKPMRFKLRQAVEARVSGGERAVGKVLVRASDDMPVSLPRVLQDRSFLLFLKELDGRLYVLHPPLLIQNTNVTYSTPWKVRNAPQNALETLSLSELRRIVRDAKTSWLLGTDPTLRRQ